VQIAINEVQKVVSQLNIQVTNIYNKITQLTKRQQWLLNWENKLYVDLRGFSKDVTRFRSVESNLYSRQISLYKEQQTLKKKAQNVQVAIQQLKEEYEYVVNYINYLEVYEQEIYSIYTSVSSDVSSFISAYEEFTCEDNLLYYEACAAGSSSAPAAAAPAS
jgi:chromosome segregation ATPase